MIHLYAFCSELDRLPDVSGIGDAPLAAEHVDGIVAVVSERAGSGVGHEDVLAHGLVVESLVGTARAVLPVRFGETFADRAALTAAIRPRLDALRGALETVRDCVELGVRIDAPPRAVAAESGTDYMRARLSDVALETELRRSVNGLVRAAAASRSPGRGLSFLVERRNTAAVEERVRTFATAHADAAIACTGPWAPYSFGGDT